LLYLLIREPRIPNAGENLFKNLFNRTILDPHKSVKQFRLNAFLLKMFLTVLCPVIVQGYWDLMPCSQVEIYRRFGEMYRLQI